VACEDVMREVRTLHIQLREDATVVKQLEVDRLDDMLLSVWARARSGDLEAIVGVLRIMERRAKLCALDGPIRVAQTTTSGADVLGAARDWSEAEIHEIASVLAQFGQLVTSLAPDAEVPPDLRLPGDELPPAPSNGSARPL